MRYISPTRTDEISVHRGSENSHHIIHTFMTFQAFSRNHVDTSATFQSDVSTCVGFVNSELDDAMGIIVHLSRLQFRYEKTCFVVALLQS